MSCASGSTGSNRSIALSPWPIMPCCGKPGDPFSCSGRMMCARSWPRSLSKRCPSVRIELLIIGRNEVRVLALPEMVVVVAQSFPTRLTFEGAALDASERIAVIAASQVETTNDEDVPTIVHPCHVALVLPDAGRASVSAQDAARKPDTVNGSEPPTLKVRQRNADGETLVSSCFISAEELYPSEAAAASALDVPAELQVVKPLLPPQGIELAVAATRDSAAPDQLPSHPAGSRAVAKENTTQHASWRPPQLRAPRLRRCAAAAKGRS